MPTNEPEKPRQVSNAMKFTGIAFQMIAVIGMLTFIGYEIDQHYHHKTAWATALCSLLGVGAALYLVFNSLKD